MISSATVTQKAWLASTPRQTCRALGSGRSWAPAMSRGIDRSRDQAGDFLGTGPRDRLFRDPDATAQHQHAVGDGEDVRHAMADQNDGDTIGAQAADQVQDL